MVVKKKKGKEEKRGRSRKFLGGMDTLSTITSPYIFFSIGRVCAGVQVVGMVVSGHCPQSSHLIWSVQA